MILTPSPAFRHRCARTHRSSEYGLDFRLPHLFAPANHGAGRSGAPISRHWARSRHATPCVAENSHATLRMTTDPADEGHPRRGPTENSVRAEIFLSATPLSAEAWRARPSMSADPNHPHPVKGAVLRHGQGSLRGGAGADYGRARPAHQVLGRRKTDRMRASGMASRRAGKVAEPGPGIPLNSGGRRRTPPGRNGEGSCPRIGRSLTSDRSATPGCSNRGKDHPCGWETRQAALPYMVRGDAGRSGDGLTPLGDS